MNKICKKCGNEKPISQFYKRTGGGHHHSCKDCYCAYYRHRYAMCEATGSAKLQMSDTYQDQKAVG